MNTNYKSSLSPHSRHSPLSLHLTKDGSTSLFSEAYGQLYHSNGGALTESEYVYFEVSGLKQVIENALPVNILEIGFGTGLNLTLALTHYLEADTSTSLHFYSIEAHPIHAGLFKKLNYAELLNRPSLADLLLPVFEKLSPGMNHFRIFPDKEVYLYLFVGTFEEFDAGKERFGFILHDPFSPRVNAELWTRSVFEKLKTSAAEKAVLTTYCSASSARAAMAAAGWKIARAPGIAGKREMTIASLSDEKLSGFKRLDEKKLADRYLSGEFGQ